MLVKDFPHQRWTAIDHIVASLINDETAMISWAVFVVYLNGNGRFWLFKFATIMMLLEFLPKNRERKPLGGTHRVYDQEIRNFYC